MGRVNEGKMRIHGTVVVSEAFFVGGLFLAFDPLQHHASEPHRVIDRADDPGGRWFDFLFPRRSHCCNQRSRDHQGVFLSLVLRHAKKHRRMYSERSTLNSPPANLGDDDPGTGRDLSIYRGVSGNCRLRREQCQCHRHGRR